MAPPHVLGPDGGAEPSAATLHLRRSRLRRNIGLCPGDAQGAGGTDFSVRNTRQGPRGGHARWILRQDPRAVLNRRSLSSSPGGPWLVPAGVPLPPGVLGRCRQFSRMLVEIGAVDPASGTFEHLEDSRERTASCAATAGNSFGRPA